MVSSPGIGSGLDIRSLVDQLVTAERQPILRVAAQEAKLQTQLSAYGQLKGALSTFRGTLTPIDDTNDFKALTATSSATSVLVAAASTDAARGVLNIEVERIAENHRLASATTFADTGTTTIGTGGATMTIAVGSEAFTVEHGGKTLAEIRDAINAASDNTGVTASILNDDVGNRLYLTADGDGSENFVTVTYSTADPFSLQSVNQDRNSSSTFTAVDLDAEMLVENLYTVTSSSNTISDAIQGVTLNLVAAGTTRVTVDHDRSKVEKNVQGFVDGFNKLLSTLRTLSQGALSTDRAAVLRLESQLRAELNEAAPAGSAFASIFDLGVKSKFVIGSTTGDNGLLEFDAAKLRSALETDPEGVAALFAAAETGVATRLQTLVTGHLQSTGLIAGKEQAITARIDSMSDRRAEMERRLETMQQQLLKRYNALDTLLGQLQSTQSYLTQQLESIKINN